MGTPAALAFTAKREREIIAVFRQEHATSGPKAQPLRQLGLRDSRVLRSLITATVIRKAGPERYFLDETAWAARPQPTLDPRRVILFLVGLAVVAIVIFLARRG